MAGVAGFEPTDDGIKNRCLTAWRHPNKESIKTEMTWAKAPASGDVITLL